MEPEQALDPFFTTKANKKTGLGLSLFRQAAEAAGGGLSVGRSDELGGVAVRAWMRLGDVDRPPLGDVAASIATMVATNPEIEFRVDLDRRRGAHLAARPGHTSSASAELTTFQEALPVSHGHYLRTVIAADSSEGEGNG